MYWSLLYCSVFTIIYAFLFSLSPAFFLTLPFLSLYLCLLFTLSLTPFLPLLSLPPPSCSQYNCCGITTPNDWITYNIIPSNRPPPSCCPSLTSTTGAAGAEVGRTQCDRNQAFSRGCVQPLAAYEERQYSIMGPIGLAFGLFQVCMYDNT